MDAPNNMIPGLDVVGRGLYLKPHQPYELRRLLFEQAEFRSYESRETKQTYAVPEGFQVEESPPMPKGAALNIVTIEESWERFHDQRSLDISAAGKGVSFSVSTTASASNELRSEQECYYAVRSSFVALWGLYVEDPSEPTVEIDTVDIPTPFSTEHRARYEAFFQRYGTHFVKRAWVGGKAELIVTVAKSSSLDKSSIQAGLKASFATYSGSASTSASASQEKLQSESNCTVLGRGGVETKLAAMSSLDPESYNAWIETIRDNPQTIEIEVAGIWTLLGDQPEVAATLMEAYRMNWWFRPLSGVLAYDDDVYFLRGRRYFIYDVDEHRNRSLELLGDKWPYLDEVGFDAIDAAFSYKGKGCHPDLVGDRVYMFRRNHYVVLDAKTGEFIGEPRRISEGWPGVEFKKIDAVITTDESTIYMFSGKHYVRFDPEAKRVVEGYPQPIKQRWLGVSFDRIDAAIYWDEGKIYFFRGDQYIRYDIVTLRADPGFPKPVQGNYVQDWKLFG